MSLTRGRSQFPFDNLLIGLASGPGLRPFVWTLTWVVTLGRPPQGSPIPHCH